MAPKGKRKADKEAEDPVPEKKRKDEEEAVLAMKRELLPVAYLDHANTLLELDVATAKLKKASNRAMAAPVLAFCKKDFQSVMAGDGAVTLFVSFANTVHCVQVHLLAPVKALKVLLWVVAGSPVDATLTYKGQALDDDETRTLESYGITARAELALA